MAQNSAAGMKQKGKVMEIRRKIKTITISFVFISLSLCLLVSFSAFSHPGKTDAEGCHRVTKDYKYIGSKKTIKAGTTHCHGGLGKMKLGKEILEDPYDAAEEVKPPKSNRPSLKASGDPPKPPAKGEGKSK